MAEAENSLISVEAKVDGKKEEATKSIRASFDMLKALLDQRKDDLVNKACSMAQEKKDALVAQKTVLSVAQKEVQCLVELVERNVEGTSDQDLMSVQRTLKTKMEEEEQRGRQLLLEPSATADITCNLPSLDVIPKCLGVVFDQCSQPQLFNIFNMNINSVELGPPVCLPPAQHWKISMSV